MTLYRTRNEKETHARAQKIAPYLKGGEVLLLKGELGAGKTTFMKGLAHALGVKKRVKSPTFVLMHIHQLRNSIQRTRAKLGAGQEFEIKNLVHVDAYRIKNPKELIEAGLMDLVGRPDTVVVVEWGEKIQPLLKKKQYTMIEFAHGKTRNERTISFTRKQ